MRPIVYPDEEGSESRAQHLGRYITWDQVPAKLSRRRQGDGHRGIQMSAANGSGHQDAHEDGHGPAEGNDDPAAGISLGSSQDDVGDDAIAQEDQQSGSNQVS